MLLYDVILILCLRHANTISALKLEAVMYCSLTSDGGIKQILVFHLNYATEQLTIVFKDQECFTNSLTIRNMIHIKTVIINS